MCGTDRPATSTTGPAVSAPSGTPAFLIPGYQVLLLVGPDDQLSVAVLTVAPVGTTESPIIVADLRLQGGSRAAQSAPIDALNS